ncbi:MAG: Diguanylate phosphodiesterase [Ramlibacter sp.]|nr:Diguanylate phosphodiesterase [Ramlibacter sp.]
MGQYLPVLLIHAADREAARRIAETSVAAASGWGDVEFDWRHRDGSLVRLQESAVAIRDEKDRLVGFRGASRLVHSGWHTQALMATARRRVTEVLLTRSVDIALQPIVSLASGRLAGVEALARFHDGRSPDLWFREAEECGQRRELDELTFAAALALFGSLPESIYLSVNAGPDLLIDHGFQEWLRDSGVPLDRLVIEVTEHAQVPDYAVLNGAIKTLREFGVRFAIDDAGAGYASLNHVIQLRPDIIKIDRALIMDLGEDRARRSLVTALVLLALELGASVTGEGTETADQLQTLATLGVDDVQGYLLATPTTDRKDWQTWAQRHWIDTFPVEPLQALGA